MSSAGVGFVLICFFHELGNGIDAFRGKVVGFVSPYK